MSPKPIPFILALSALAAAFVVFHPGRAYAETPLAKLAPQTSFPDSGTFTVDPMHTCIGFDIGHLGLSRVQGRFDKFTGSLTADSKDPSKSSVEITAQSDSVDTNVAPRDADLRSANFFDVEKFPTLTFKSTKITKRGKGFLAEGELTIKGVAKPVSIPFQAYGPIKDPWGATRIGIVAQPIVIHRQEFGMTFDLGPVSDDVTVRLSLEATLNK
jgi:polyisoprenoid-binding protein YceI